MYFFYTIAYTVYICLHNRNYIMLNNTNRKLHKEPIFLIACGRSGSTWLQKIINTHPNIVLWGEHAGFINSLADSYYVVANRPQILEYDAYNKERELLLNKLYNDDFNPAWTNVFTKESFLEAYRQMFLQLFVSNIEENIRWGFKEIRYCNVETLHFLRVLFPKAQFIFLKRDIFDVCKSQLLSFYADTIKSLDESEMKVLIYELYYKIIDMYKEMEKFQLQIENKYYINILYEDLVQDYDKEITRLFDFLDAEINNEIVTNLDNSKGVKIHPTRKDDKLRHLVYNTVTNNDFIPQDTFKNICKKKKIQIIEELMM